MKHFIIISFFLSALIGTAVFNGCSLSSADSTSRSVNMIVQGYYTGKDRGRLVQNNTGATILSLDLRQSGDQLEAVDNNGMIFRGSIGRVDDSTLQTSFTLTGSTTAGQEGSMAGVIAVEGNTGVMQGTWAEPSLFSTFYGVGTVPQTPTDSNSETNSTAPSTSNTVSDITIDSGDVTVDEGSPTSFSVTKYSGTVTWTYDGTGDLSPTTSPSTTLTPTTSGTLKASDTSGGSDSISITVTPASTNNTSSGSSGAGFSSG